MAEKIGGSGGIDAEAHFNMKADGLAALLGIRQIKIPITAALANGETDTGLDLPLNCVVLPWAIVDVRVAEVTGGTKTLEVGTLSGEAGGDADGFVDAVSVASTGMKVCLLANGAETLGALLKELVAGGVARAPVPYAQNANPAAKSLSVSAPNAFTEFRGDVYLFIVEPFTSKNG